MSEELCEGIKFADENVVFDSESQNYTFKDEIFKVFCSLNGKGEKGQCDKESLKVSSGFMGLLEYFKSIDEEGLDGDKLAQYAILWFNYKISQNQNIEIIRGTLYNILTQNNWFSEYSESIENRKDTMKIHYLYLKNLYDFLKGICETINKCKDSPTSNECKKYGEKCSDLYRACILHLPWREICNPYCSVLTNLKNDYDKLKEKYKLPELKLPEGLYDCKTECHNQEERHKASVAVQNRSSDGSEIDTSTNASLPGPSVPPTSINNGNKLPYIAVPLILIPIILGISYKYLTPVWRKKMKKKNMKKIINLSDQKKA
ncbi:CIR protein [Plasmodium chabaudi chabaudi]|uniref:CIR protein n=1 Tax=Plasmodium chabaudi chabaudi TaxID=31271 RepID=A0A077TJJ8_PLACU|nr:CIR protein [Plasmodium chabaudi chabaudi]SCL88644.1 CIR protein [Plasmodium chabaudi chabaudi]VTZ67330.1 CIR protein [Plasmodium chabaudi chabaudi]|eukprot:XP_016653356.1 CIR protein [Plasmodium chabaudi chabaudi]